MCKFDGHQLCADTFRLFDLVPDPMWVFDRASLRLLAVNRAASNLFGYSQAEFLTMSIADICPEEARPEIRGAIAAITGEQSAVDGGVWRILCKDGGMVRAQFHWRLVDYEGQQGVLASVRDVTRLVEMEAERSTLLQREREGHTHLMQATRLLSIAGDAAHLGGWRVELDPERIVWTPGTARIHGEPEGTSPSIEQAIEYYVPEHRAQIRAAFAECAAEGAPFDHVLQMTTATGRRIWVRSVGEAERAADGNIVAVQGAIQDVTELMESRDHNALLQRRLYDTLDSISDAFCMLDAQWCITFWNRQAEKLLGRTRHDLLGTAIGDMFPAAKGTVFQAELQNAATLGETKRFVAYAAEGNRWFELNAYPTPDGIAVYFRDVTDERLHNDQLRAIEERFRLVCQATNDVIWDWDLVRNAIWWNDNLQVVFGYDPANFDPSPESWVGRIHSDDRGRVLNSIHAVIDSNDNNWRAEYRFAREDGRYAIVVDRGFVARDASGRAVRMIGSMTDITARHDLEARLRQAQKLEAVGQLTGGIAHDFNNLLTVILGNAELLSEQLHEEQHLRQLAQMTAIAAQRGAELTSRLLAFARRQPLSPQCVDLGAQVEALEALLRRTLNEDIDIRLVRAASSWIADVDPGQFEVALLNLAINARDAMPRGGELTIEIRDVSLDGEHVRHQHDDMSPGDYVLVSVTDSGEGMTPETVSRAFEPFFTTKDVGKGSGLGLSMVYGFVRQSEGHIRIHSELGEGTTVRLYFPRADSAATNIMHVPEKDQLTGGNEHILMVEDDALVRDNLVAQLIELGYSVTSAGDGVEAMRLLQQTGPFDLLLTDVVMPGGVNGRDLARAARKLRPDLRVLFMSGYPKNALVRRGRLDRGVHLLTKPYRRQELAWKLRQALDQVAQSA